MYSIVCKNIFYGIVIGEAVKFLEEALFHWYRFK